MVTRRRGKDEASPVLRELRRWERRTRRGEVPPRARAQAWIAAVAAARQDGGAEARELAARLRTILRLGVEATIARLEQVVGLDQPLPEPAFTRQLVRDLQRDLRIAAALGGRVRAATARLGALLTAHLAGRLLALEASARAGGAAAAGQELPGVGELWQELVEAEAHGAPDLEPLAARLANVQAGLEALAQAGAPGSDVPRPDPLAFLSLASRAGSLGRSVVEAWAAGLARQFGGRPWWDEFVGQVRTLAFGDGPAATAPLPPTLVAILDFVRGQDGRAAELSRGLLSGIQRVEPYALPEMPLAQKTQVQIDWVAGEPDPWERGDFIARAQAAAATLVGRGIQLELVRGRPVPAERYDPSQARRAADLVLPGPRGPVTLDQIEILERAMPLAQRPGFLQALLPPSTQSAAREPGRADLPALPPTAPTRAAKPLAKEAAAALAEPIGPHPGLQLRKAASTPHRARAAAERVRIELDWVAGEDPWKRRDALARARRMARSLESQGIRVEFVRGREVPAERYVASRGRRAADYSAPGPRGPVDLRRLDLLEGAMPLEQRPGLLHVLVAPARPAQARGVATAAMGTEKASVRPPGFAAGRRARAMPGGKPPGSGLIGPEARVPATQPPGRAGTADDSTLPPLKGQLGTGLAAAKVGLLRGEPGLRVGATPGRAAARESQASGAAAMEPDIGFAAPQVAGHGMRGRGPALERVRVELDWVAGEDPWKRRDALARARRMARGLESQGVRLEFVRGREVPSERYVEAQSQPAAAFGVAGPRGPVDLRALSLLDRAMLIARRPGRLHVLLAPHAEALAAPTRFARPTRDLGDALGPGATSAGLRPSPAGGRARPGTGLFGASAQPHSALPQSELAPRAPVPPLPVSLAGPAGEAGILRPAGADTAAERRRRRDRRTPRTTTRMPVGAESSAPRPSGTFDRGFAAEPAAPSLAHLAVAPAGQPASLPQTEGRTPTARRQRGDLSPPSEGGPEDGSAFPGAPGFTRRDVAKAAGLTPSRLEGGPRVSAAAFGPRREPPIPSRREGERVSRPLESGWRARPLRPGALEPRPVMPASKAGATSGPGSTLAPSTGVLTEKSTSAARRLPLSVEPPVVGAIPHPAGLSSLAPQPMGQRLELGSDRPAWPGAPASGGVTSPAGTPSARGKSTAHPMTPSSGVAPSIARDDRRPPLAGVGLVSSPGPFPEAWAGSEGPGAALPARQTAHSVSPGHLDLPTPDRSPAGPKGAIAGEGSARPAWDESGAAAGRDHFVSPAPTAGASAQLSGRKPLAPRLRRDEVARAAVDRPAAQPSESRSTGASAARVEAPSSGETSAAKQPNLDALAQQVYAILKRRLAVERERSGGGRFARAW